MKSLQVVGAECAPVPVHVTKLSLMGQCSDCKNILCRDCMGLYHGAYFCDQCADQLQPDRYNADLFTIISAANDQCGVGIGMTMTEAIYDGRIVLVEDDMGDLAYASLNYRNLLTKAPSLGSATTDFLPVEIGLSHRKRHRECIKTLVHRGCLQTVDGQHWDCQIMPFVVEQETFTLTVFRRMAS